MFMWSCLDFSWWSCLLFASSWLLFGVVLFSFSVVLFSLLLGSGFCVFFCMVLSNLFGGPIYFSVVIYDFELKAEAGWRMQVGGGVG